MHAITVEGLESADSDELCSTAAARMPSPAPCTITVQAVLIGRRHCPWKEAGAAMPALRRVAPSASCTKSRCATDGAWPQVLAHVATRLRDMHQAGFVHRDIKPSNIMLLPRENRWTVIDFGSAARAARLAGLSYTMIYAAPEVAASVHSGARSIVVDPAVDAWALGVVAYELLTGQPTFDLLRDGKQSVRFAPAAACTLSALHCRPSPTCDCSRSSPPFLLLRGAGLTPAHLVHLPGQNTGLSRVGLAVPRCRMRVDPDAMRALSQRLGVRGHGCQQWVQVSLQLRGEQELPWEGERLRSRPDLRKRLGVFKHPVLALLHRDPVRRASMTDFCLACDTLFSSAPLPPSSTQTTPPPLPSLPLPAQPLTLTQVK